MKYFFILFLILFPKFLFAKTLATYQNITVTQEEAEFKAKTLGIQNYFAIPKENQNKILLELIKEKSIEAEAKKQKLEKATEYESLTRNILINNYIIKNSPNIESEVNTLYTKYKAELEGKTIYTFYHILSKTEPEAETIKKEILSSKSNWKQKFTELATTKSIDTATAKNGGYVGKVIETFLPKELTPELSKLKPNTISNPIKTNLGYHIIYIESKEDVKIPTLSESKQALLNQLLLQKKEEIASKLIDTNKIKFNN